MPVTEQVLIEFVADDSGVESAIEKLHKVGHVDQENYDLFKKNNQQYAERVKAMEGLASAQTALAEKSKVTEKSLDSLAKSAKSLTDNMLKDGSSKLLDNLNKQLVGSEQAMKDFEEGVLLGIAEELERAGVSADEFAEGLKGLENQSKASDASQKSLKAQLKDMKLALAELKLAGKGNTEEYEAMRLKAGELSDAIGDVNEEVSRAGSDTSGIDKLISTTSAAMGAFQMAQGAAAMFGDENENLQETFVRLQAGMSILQGLQAVGTEIAREDSVVKKGLAVANTITAATQRALGIATAETSLSFKILRTAILTTGIGALIVGIGMLIAHWDEVKAKFIEVKDKAEELYENFALVRYIVNATVGPLILLYKGLKSIAEVMNLIDDEATTKLKEGLDASVISAEDLSSKLTAQADIMEAIGGKSQSVLDIRKRALESEELMLRKKLELATLNEDEEKAAELTNELHKNRINHLKLEDEIMAFQVKKLRDQGASESEILNFQKQRINSRINELELIIKQAEALQMLEGGLFDSLRDGFVSAVNVEIEMLRNKMETIQNDFDSKIKTTKEKAEKLKPIIPVVPEVPFDEVRAMGEKLEKELNRLPPVQINSELVVDQGEDAMANFRETANIDAMSLAQKKQYYNDQYNALRRSLQLNEITKDEYYLREQERQQRAAEVEVEIENKKADQIKAIKTALAQAVAQTALALIDNAKQRNREELDDKLSQISEERNALDELYNSKTITENEYQKQKKILEKQEADAKRRAWQRDRELAIYEIGIKTAQGAIASFVSMGGGPQGAIAAAAAIAFGLIQLDKVYQQKPPKFAKGTKNAPPGWKWVGEEGPELINTPGGEEIKTHADSVAFANLFNRMDQFAQVSGLAVNSNGVLVQSNPEYAKLIDTMEAVKESIDKVTIQQTILDRRGYKNAIVSGDNVTYELGGRF